MKLRKIIGLAVLLVVLTCGLSFAETINLLMEGVPDTFIIQEILPEFKRETGITVNFEIVNYAQMHAKLLPQLMSKRGAYDAIVVDNYWAGEFPAGGWLEPLDQLAATTDSVELDQYVPSMLEMVGYYEGTLYMIPFYNYTMLLFYRTDLIEDPKLQQEYKRKYGRELKIPNNLKAVSYTHLTLPTSDLV